MRSPRIDRFPKPSHFIVLLSATFLSPLFGFGGSFHLENVGDNTILSTYHVNYKTDVRPVQQTVTGTISDERGQPLPGASVVEKGTTNGVSTDFDGNYTIEISSGEAVLEFSYLGYLAQEVPVDGQKQP